MIDIDLLKSMDFLILTELIIGLVNHILSQGKTPREPLVNQGSNFPDFVRFRLHTYARTQQSLPPFLDGNKHNSQHKIPKDM